MLGSLVLVRRHRVLCQPSPVLLTLDNPFTSQGISVSLLQNEPLTPALLASQPYIMIN